MDKASGHHKASAGRERRFSQTKPTLQPIPLFTPGPPKTFLAAGCAPHLAVGEKTRGKGPRAGHRSERCLKALHQQQHKEGKFCFQRLTEASLAYTTGREHPIKAARHTNAHRQRLSPHPTLLGRDQGCMLQGASGGRGGQSQVRSRTQHAWMSQGITPGRLQPGWRGEGKAPGSPQPPAQAWRAVRGGEGARCCQKGARPLRATAAGRWPRGDVRLQRGWEPRGSTPRHTEHGGEAGQGPRSSPHEAVPPGVSPRRAAGTAGVGAVRRESRRQSEPGAAGGSRRPAEADLFACLPAFLLPHFFPMTSA